jgi:hypothetical protein
MANGRALIGLMQSGDGLDGGDHAGAAIVLAGVANDINVGAQHKRGQTWRVPFVTADSLAHGIDSGGHGRPLHSRPDL